MNRKMKYFQAVPLILLMLISLSACSGKEETQMETDVPMQQQEQVKGEEPVVVKEEKEEGFATSQEAVLAYLAGLRDNDFGRMEDSFFDQSRAVDISNQYVHLCGIDLIPEIASDGYVKLSEDGEAEKFLKEELNGKIEETDFAGMEFLGFIPAGYFTDSYSTKEYQDYLKNNAKDNGGSELENQVAAIRINGTTYLLFFDTIKADDRWYVLQLGGLLPNLLGAEPEELVVRLGAENEEILEAALHENADTPELPQSGVSAAGSGRIESEGYDTPEDAVAAYLEGVKACDTEQMIRTFSVESYAQNYNMQAYLEHMQAYMFLQQEVAVPTANDFTKAMIACERREQLKEDILMQGNALYLWDCYYHNTEPEQDTPFSWEELQKKLDLDSIEVVEFVPPETIAEKSGSEQVNAMRDERAGICGAEQQQDCVVVFTCGGEKYCLFMEEMQYNGKWYNSGFGNFAFTAIGGYDDTMGTLPFEALGEISDQ